MQREILFRGERVDNSEWEGSDANLNSNAVVIGNIIDNPELIENGRN